MEKEDVIKDFINEAQEQALGSHSKALKISSSNLDEAFENAVTKSILENDELFQQKKSQKTDYLKREKENNLLKDEEPLDNEMRDFIQIFNKLPFLYTVASDIGHLSTNKIWEGKDVKHPLAENEADVSSGNILFKLDYGRKSYEFMEKLMELMEKKYSDFSNLFFYKGSQEETRQDFKENWHLEFGQRGATSRISLEEAKKHEKKKEDFKKDLEELIKSFL